MIDGGRDERGRGVAGRLQLPPTRRASPQTLFFRHQTAHPVLGASPDVVAFLQDSEDEWALGMARADAADSGVAGGGLGSIAAPSPSPAITARRRLGVPQASVSLGRGARRRRRNVGVSRQGGRVLAQALALSLGRQRCALGRHAVLAVPLGQTG